MRGGMEAIYDDMAVPIGMTCFAAMQPARGGLFSARQRLAIDNKAALTTLGQPISEDELEEALRS